MNKTSNEKINEVIELMKMFELEGKMQKKKILRESWNFSKCCF